MVKSFSVLMSVMVDFGSGGEIFFVDLMSQRAFKCDGSPATDDQTDEIMSSIRGEHEATMPQVPYDQIYEVMDTERRIAQENNKHIFRRN